MKVSFLLRSQVNLKQTVFIQRMIYVKLFVLVHLSTHSTYIENISKYNLYNVNNFSDDRVRNFNDFIISQNLMLTFVKELTM